MTIAETTHPGSIPQSVRASQAGRQRGVLLINTGTPDGPDVPSVRTYLREFLSDPMVIQLPKGMRWFQSTLGRLIARFRAPKSAAMYDKIWTRDGSPLRVILQQQADALTAVLPAGWRVFVAMRYGKPDIASTLRLIDEAGIEELVVLPMYPQYSETTTGTGLRAFYKELAHAAHHISVSARSAWFDDCGYVNAQAKLIADYAGAHGLDPRDTHLLFSAHGLPVSYISRGDPYKRHVDRTVDLITHRLGWPTDRVSVGFQSRLGPVQWLAPTTEDRLNALADAGEKQVLVCSISFTADCLETLEEIDVRHREQFGTRGGQLHRCPSLNTYEPFVAALKNIVLRGPQPVVQWNPDTVPLMQSVAAEQPTDGGYGTLVLVGASLAGPVGATGGPSIKPSSPAALGSVKKSHEEVYACLKRISSDLAVREVFVWNTCQRIELYAWLDDMPAGTDRACVVTQLRRRIFGHEPEGLSVNILFGLEAWHHLMRTSAGLNSGLPGDRDVAQQLQTALRLADRAGSAGAYAHHLVRQIHDRQDVLRTETRWRDFSPGYCLAALQQARHGLGLEFEFLRHVVVGGSTTSRSILETLREHFDVPSCQMALVYRGHTGGQIKLLRKAVRNGRRIRVDRYGEASVLKAIADADVVCFGIDRDEPVLGASDLADLRDFSARPLTIMDFNTHASVSDLSSIEGITVWRADTIEREVARFAQAMCDQPQFADAVADAEAWIHEHLPEQPVGRPPLPCMRAGAHGRVSCSGCWSVLQETGATQKAGGCCS